MYIVQCTCRCLNSQSYEQSVYNMLHNWWEGLFGVVFKIILLTPDENEWCKVETAETNTPPAMFGHTAVFSGPVMWLFGGSAQREIINSLWSHDTGQLIIRCRVTDKVTKLLTY